MAKIDWGRHIEAWRVSGLSQAAYCRLQGVSPRYFRKKLQADRASASASAQALIPVRVDSAATGVGMVLHTPRGYRLELPALVSPGWLAEVLQCLG
jgi:hypothetical protein